MKAVHISKQQIRLLIPLLITSVILMYCWIVILSKEALATWWHYLALGLFIPIISAYFRSFEKAAIATGGYLLLATFNVIAIRPAIVTSAFKIHAGSFDITIGPVQMLSFGLFVLYFILNLDTLIDIYLDYKESKSKNANAK